MNEVQTTQSGLPATRQVGGEEILSDSLRVPYVLLMQGLSDFVAERKAQLGDIVRGGTAEKLGDPETPLEIIPLTFSNSWVLSEKVGTKFEYRSQEPLNAANQRLEWTFKKNGTDWKRDKSFNLIALLKKDIIAFQAEMAKAERGESVDLSKGLLPVMITFRVMSYKTGGDIMKHFTNAQQFKSLPHVSVLNLHSKPTKNDKGNFFVWELGRITQTPKELLPAAAEWRAKVVASTVVADDPLEEPADVDQGPPPSQTTGPARF